MAKELTYLVRVKSGCKHRTEDGVVLAGETTMVIRAELDAFQDKLELVDEASPEPIHKPAPEPPKPKATTPAVEFAAANGVDMDMVPPTGANGKITLSDVKRYIGEL